MVHGWFGARQVLPCSRLLNGKFDARHHWFTEGLMPGMFDNDDLDEMIIGVRKVRY